ncbi:MAG: hypothetical protein R3E57_07350 [Porticoccaceae bacterium]
MAKRKSEKREREKRLTVRFNDQEYRALQDFADRAGLSLSGYLRHTTLNTKPPRQSHRPVKDHEKLAALLAGIGSVGSNINQLAYTANSGSWPERERLEEACAHVREIRDLLMEALGRQPIPDRLSGHDP